MNDILLLLLKGLLAGVIVGFVTSSIKSWVDRIFMVIMLVSIVSLPIQEAITINLIVLGLSALMLTLRQWPVLNSVREDWPRLIIPGIVGGGIGKIAGIEHRSSCAFAGFGNLCHLGRAASRNDQTHA